MDDSDSSHQSDNPRPKWLKTLASDEKFTEGNSLLHQLVLDHSDPTDSVSGPYMNAVLLSMSDVPASVVNALNNDGYSALHLAVSKNNLTMVKKLLSRLVHVDVNARCGRDDGNTALHLAVKLRHSSIVRELLNKGASIAIMNSYEETALSVATRLRALDLVKLLVSTDVNQPTLYNAPLHEAAYYGSLEIVEFLIDRGADVDAEMKRYVTPLHVAVCTGNLDTVKLLIGKGANVHVTDGDGATPLHLAVLFGNLECVAFLIEQDADLDARDALGRTPLHVAVERGSPDIAKLLIRKGADLHLHAININRWTPLHIAAYYGHVEVVEALMDRGADVSAKNREGKTPLDLARESGNQSCIDVLEKVW